MKILRRGTKLEQKKKTTYISECSNCGCVFEFTGDEIKYPAEDARYAIKDHVHCPQCNMFIYDWKEK